MKCSPFKYGLFWVSIFVVAMSAWLLNGRLTRRHEMRMARQEQQEAQRATALLARAFYADNFLTFAAISKTTAMMGNNTISSKARVVHAPRRLSIVYFEGDYAGLNSGYNEHWAWRQKGAAQPMIPYAEMERSTTDMVAKRFPLLLQNYAARYKGIDPVSGREAELVELRPIHPAKGAKGPAKKIWVDKESGLTLRQQSFNYQMIPVMESVLSDVNMAPQITPTTFVPPARLQQAALKHPWMAHDAVTDATRVSQLAGITPPHPESKALPAGFEFDSVGCHRCNSPHGKANEAPCYSSLARYTDGLNTLTIFAFKPGCMDFKEGKGNQAKLKKNLNNAHEAASANAMALPVSSDEPDEQHTCDYGAGTMVIRNTDKGDLIAVADLPPAVLNRVLEATTFQLYKSGKG